MSIGAFTAVLSASKLKVAAVAAGALVVVVGAAVAFGLLGAPAVTDVDNEFGDVDESTTVIETDLVVENPNPFGAKLGGVTVDYTVAMNGVELAEGTREGLDVGTGNSTVEFATRMDNEQIPEWWYRHVDRGEQSNIVIEADAHSSTLDVGTDFQHERSIETDVISEFDSEETREVNANDPVLSTIPGFGDPIMYIEETNGEWGDVTRERTEMDVDFVAHNPSQLRPVAITQLEYEVTMNGVQVGEGASDREYVIEPGQTERVETTTAIQNDQLDEWWVTHLQNDQTTSVEIEFYAVVEIGGETVRLPLDALDHEETIETDIFAEE